MRTSFTVASAVFAFILPGAATAHFVLVSPTPTLVQDQRGDPQKMGPCGGTTANPGTSTNVVHDVRGGETLHFKIQETIYHPGHYRIALSRTPAGLPPDPETITRETPRGPYSVSAKIEARPQAPILVDGLFVHTERPAVGTFWETDVRIPNVNCANCTLQVIQWMAEHGYNADGGYTYHHCAAIKIVANPAIPMDSAWSTVLNEER